MPLLATAALAAGFALQPTGTFHADEPVARDGERWLALVDDTAGRPALVATSVQVHRVHDPIADADDGPATGLEVTAVDVDPHAETAMLLRGPRLRPGAIEAGRVLDRPDDAGPEAIAAFVFRGTTWRLRARCPERGDTVASAADDAPAWQACDLALDNGRERQVLQTVRGMRQGDGRWAFGDEAGPVLLQVGDFDRDGRPDLILDTTDHYNVSRPTLFLSGGTRDGELVRRVAGYESVGC
ncbi:hypothetical protein [Lysobacter humi (ex Lee et al. 2017)]